MNIEYLAKLRTKGHRNGKVTIHPPESLVRQRFKSGRLAPTPLELRVVKVKTSDHKTALFVTTLTDRAKYPLRSIRERYHFRGEEEEFYKANGKI